MNLRDARDQIEHERPDLRGDAKIKAIRDLRRTDQPATHRSAGTAGGGFVVLALLLVGLGVWLAVSGHLANSGILFVVAVVCLRRAAQKIGRAVR